MNLLTISREDIITKMHEVQQAIDTYVKERDELIAVLAEKDRLEALSAQFGNISENDIKQIREAQVLRAQSIQSEESVKLN